MGQASYKRIGILISCLVLTSLLVHWHRPSKAIIKGSTLGQHLVNIGDWKNDGSMELNPTIVKNLKLDDYISRNYKKGQDTISLYIGYYLTTKKVGAAHDPLVCFPGQGWFVSDLSKGELVLDRATNTSISYSSMTVELGPHKELIIYWFQSYHQTNPDTLSQKITSLWYKLFHGRQDNAFVRISTSIEGESLSAARQTLFDFIRAFYPTFLNYVKS